MADISEAVDATPLADDFAWSHDIVQNVSRTFAITVDVLDEPMSSSICTGYLLCRIPDTIEDARHIPPDEKVSLLETYGAVLDPDEGLTAEAFEDEVATWIPDDGNADWDLVAQTGRVFRVFDAQSETVREAIRPSVSEMVDGMATFVSRYAEQGGLRLQTRAELHEYCHYAAGTVGQLVTNLVCSAETHEQLEANAEAFGLGLQLVNICKDVGADFYEENNVYLPAAELTARGVSQNDLCNSDNEAATVDVVLQTVENARTQLDDARIWLDYVPEESGNRVAAWAIPYLLAVATLREIESRPADVLDPAGVKISRQEVGRVIETCIGGLDTDQLRNLRRQIAAEPFL